MRIFGIVSVMDDSIVVGNNGRNKKKKPKKKTKKKKHQRLAVFVEWNLSVMDDSIANSFGIWQATDDEN